MTIGELLSAASNKLSKAGIATGRLDVLVLLQDALECDKAWLIANTDYQIPAELLATLKKRINQRLKRTPLAYIRGSQEFYGREFMVTPDVLIPRPDTEVLIEMINGPAKPGSLLLDVGTGSGAIAITAALENPNLVVEACDVSPAALKIAMHNAKKLGAKIKFFESNLLAGTTKQYDIVVANLPYVSRVWQRSAETNAEPDLALFANNDGLELIYELIKQAPVRTAQSGQLILEADPRQHSAIEKAAHQSGFRLVAAKGFGLAFKKV